MRPRSLAAATVLWACALGSLAAAPAAATPPPAASAPATSRTATSRTTTSRPATSRPVPAIAEVITRGNGPIPMILVPGLSCDASVFSAFMDRNAAQYTMYAVTLAGNGGTPALPDPNDPAYEHTPWLAAADAALAALVADRRLDHPVIVGHSLGGLLALRCSAEHPGLFRAAVTLDGYPAFPLLTPMTPAQRAAFVDDRLAKALFASTAGFAARQRISIAGLVTSPQRAKELGDLSAKTPPEVTLRYLLEVTASDITDLLKQSTTPTLAITAASGLTPDMTARAEATIHAAFDPTKNITLVVLVNRRHFIQDDAPEALDQTLATFLSHHTPPPRLVITPTTHPK